MDLQARKRVTADSLSLNIGKAVTLFGEILELDPNGRTFTIRASSKDVTVQLEEPLQDIMQGLVEVQGIVSSDNSIKCLHIVSFPANLSEKFDNALYNEVVGLTERLPTHYVTM